MLSKTAIEERQIRALESKLEAYVRRYPAMTAGHSMLGGIKVELGDHEGAIDEFKAGLAVDDPTIQKWGLWRHLTVSYTKLGLYTDALVSAGGAIQLKPDVTRDREFIYAMALSETHLGLLEDAQKALQLTLSRYPEAKQDPEFQAVARLLYDKLQQQKQAAKP
jgi:tetratricopeptide (TPR) repeat protein